MYTIIIANYNRTSKLKRCLDSIDVAFNRFIRPEIIVIEDGSTKILKDDRITQHIILSKNGGPVRARLEGAKNVKFKYIILLDSDDTLLKDAVNTIETIKNDNPDYDLYGFTYKGGESLINFEVRSIKDYSDFVSFEGRTSDYMMVVKSDVLKQYIYSHSYRISEIWLFSEIFIEYNGFYSKNSIFNYHQDAEEQLSKKRDFRFKLDRYERNSVSKSVDFFISFISICKSNSLRKAWRRRLLKESVLSFNLTALKKIICLKK
ncbi:glycosyltransferase family 2 protein [Aeromonas bestiarum]|uniref:Glycosyl transferase, group 2 family protein n=1 Tax=Aeromonas bestiarum TaxID=105751 RepID=A0A068FV49_9GAMM|nr:glycosyltransferase family 2 protein [Aeromonas bestiarum]AID70971.1 glycosyl transferase, group 2 family protein [Aeromonas bestiarum]POG24544.1 glycosyltransferase family 2 protein [Aeromonas bestiarum]